MKLGKLIGQGRTAEIYALSESQVVKLFRPSFPKVAIEHEYRIITQLSGKGLPLSGIQEDWLCIIDLR